MIPTKLSEQDKRQLLILARQALEQALLGEDLPPIDYKLLSPRLVEGGASFITLTLEGELRGCIGALDASLPLVEDVRCHAVAAAFQDYRFPPVCADELPDLKIEISYLSPSQQIEYSDPEELLKCLRPFVDGVVLFDGTRRATFLPQVWEKIPDPELFLSHLCRKLGSSPDLWRCHPLQVWVYQVDKFSE